MIIIIIVVIIIITTSIIIVITTVKNNNNNLLQIWKFSFSSPYLERNKIKTRKSKERFPLKSASDGFLFNFLFEI